VAGGVTAAVFLLSGEDDPVQGSLGVFSIR
jgi:hypothetical protein